VAPPGNQAVNGENKPQPVVSGETGLLDSKKLLIWNILRHILINIYLQK
jgi:hypothetical protein